MGVSSAEFPQTNGLAINIQDVIRNSPHDIMQLPKAAAAAAQNQVIPVAAQHLAFLQTQNT
jgi:hypothetical protein